MAKKKTNAELAKELAACQKREKALKSEHNGLLIARKHLQGAIVVLETEIHEGKLIRKDQRDQIKILESEKHALIGGIKDERENNANYERRIARYEGAIQAVHGALGNMDFF